MDDLISDFIKKLIIAWREGRKEVRFGIIIALVLFVTGPGIVAFTNSIEKQDLKRILENIGIGISVVGAFILLIVYTIQISKEEVRKEKRIEEVERRVQENPKETQAAWELARVKLESYLNRNLSQVRSIFWLTVIVMIAGFSLIGIGVFEAIQLQGKFNAAVLTTVSGVIVNFIGGTFLVLYKATMSQAKDYVSILERINAVGMSVQILDTIDSKTNLKQETIAEIAKQLLTMYSENITLNKRIQRTRKNLTRDL